MPVEEVLVLVDRLRLRQERVLAPDAEQELLGLQHEGSDPLWRAGDGAPGQARAFLFRKLRKTRPRRVEPLHQVVAFLRRAVRVADAVRAEVAVAVPERLVVDPDALDVLRHLADLVLVDLAVRDRIPVRVEAPRERAVRLDRLVLPHPHRAADEVVVAERPRPAVLEDREPVAAGVRELRLDERLLERGADREPLSVEVVSGEDVDDLVRGVVGPGLQRGPDLGKDAQARRVLLLDVPEARERVRTHRVLVAEGPHEDARTVLVAADRPLGAVDQEREVPVVLEQSRAVRAGRHLVQDVEAHLVRELVEVDAEGIVRRADVVDARLLHPEHLLAAELARDRAPDLRHDLVPAHAPEEGGLSVDVDLLLVRRDLADADLLAHGHAVVGDLELVEVRRLRRPELRVRDLPGHDRPLARDVGDAHVYFPEVCSAAEIRLHGDRAVRLARERDVGDPAVRRHAEDRDGAEDAGEAPAVVRVPEPAGRARLHRDPDLVRAFPERGRDVELVLVEGARHVLRDRRAVDRDVVAEEDAVEADHHLAPLPFRLPVERPRVDARQVLDLVAVLRKLVALGLPVARHADHAVRPENGVGVLVGGLRRVVRPVDGERETPLAVERRDRRVADGIDPLRRGDGGGRRGESRGKGDETAEFDVHGGHSTTNPSPPPHPNGCPGDGSVG